MERTSNGEERARLIRTIFFLPDQLSHPLGEDEMCFCVDEEEVSTGAFLNWKISRNSNIDFH
jgi:hypothetical protein